MQYAHARICSILRRAEVEAGVNLDHIAATCEIDIQHPAEVALVADIVRFQVQWLLLASSFPLPPCVDVMLRRGSE